jgi:hypothetical protein
VSSILRFAERRDRSHSDSETEAIGIQGDDSATNLRLTYSILWFTESVLDHPIRLENLLRCQTMLRVKLKYLADETEDRSCLLLIKSTCGFPSPPICLYGILESVLKRRSGLPLCFRLSGPFESWNQIVLTVLYRSPMVWKTLRAEDVNLLSDDFCFWFGLTEDSFHAQYFQYSDSQAPNIQ